MSPEPFIQTLQDFPPILAAAVANITDADVRWRPPDGAWSILEIVTHLADEESADFPPRFRLTLDNPQQDWPAIDPQRWVAERRYNHGRLDESLDRFIAERSASVDWLRSLRDPDLTRAKPHPKVGSISAGELLASWTAHDWFHLRQIAKRRIQLIERDAAPHPIGYAGGSF